MSVFRLRGLEVTLEASHPDVSRQLVHLANLADEWMPLERTVRYRLESEADGSVDVIENAEVCHRLPTPAAALAFVHRRLGTQLFSLYDRYTFVHTAAVTIGQRLVLLTGNRGTGKSTLAMRLALDGSAFHCDEHVMGSADGVVRTVPRRLHVKKGSLAVLPELASVCQRLPTLTLDDRTSFYPLDLAQLGIAWRSAEGRPSAIVHLDPAFDRPPAIHRIPQIESVRLLFGQALTSHQDFGRQAADICAIVRGVPSYRLRVGEISATADLLRTVN